LKRVDEDYMARQHVSLADDWNTRTTLTI
jgi:hypothetical protein